MNKCKECGETNNTVHHFLIEFSLLGDYNINNNEGKNETYLLSGTGFFCNKCEEKIGEFIKKYFK